MISEKQVIRLYESKFWKKLTREQIAKFQLFEDRLCVPFDIFHAALEKTLGRPIWTQEFALNRKGLMKELMQGATPPTFQEIMEMIPVNKRIIVQC